MKAVILAGGEGTRLRPLTYSIPKPLLPVGKKPILEIIIERLREYDIKDIVLAVAYKAEIIKTYFGDGKSLGVRISYSYDNEFLGTAGPIKSLEHLLDGLPFIVMNGDLLTNLDFNDMYKTHISESSELTMAVTTYKIKIPYGVIEMEDHGIISIKEKPESNHIINAGIYIVSPSVLNLIYPKKFLNMTDLIQILIRNNRKIKVYHIDGEWLDIGNMDDYNRANEKYRH